MHTRTIKVIQAVLICLGYDNGGKLNADGDWGENSNAAAQAYLEANRFKVTKGQDIKDFLFERFQDFQFDLESAKANDLRVTQAWLLTQDFDDDGKLIADGELGPCTEAAAKVYLAMQSPVEMVQKLAAHHSRGGYFYVVFLVAETTADVQPDAEA